MPAQAHRSLKGRAWGALVRLLGLALLVALAYGGYLAYVTYWPQWQQRQTARKQADVTAQHTAKLEDRWQRAIQLQLGTPKYQVREWLVDYPDQGIDSQLTPAGLRVDVWRYELPGSQTLELTFENDQLTRIICPPRPGVPPPTPAAKTGTETPSQPEATTPSGELEKTPPSAQEPPPVTGQTAPPS